ncbi:hypothetical protein [Haliangium sp.]|uniref:DUF7948 domain-containing protein n=1 Tax=Haliangium sp. TaxID=2663208 RepID=UPI003D0D7B23
MTIRPESARPSSSARPLGLVLWSLAGLSLGAGLAGCSDAATPAPGAAEHGLCTDEPPPAINLGTAVPLGFVANQGQSDGSVRFQATALGGASFFVAADGSVRFAVPEAAGLPAVSSELRFAGAAEPDLALGEPLGRSDSFYLGADEGAWVRDLPAHDSLMLSGLYPGVEASLAGDGRRLYLRMSGRVDDIARVRWSHSGDIAARADGSAVLVPVDDAGGSTGRVLVWARPTVTVAGEPGAGAVIQEDEHLAVAIADAGGDDVATVALQFVLGPVIDDYRGFGNRDALTAVGAEAGAGLWEQPTTARDLFVAGFEGERLVRVSHLGGRGDEAPGGVAVDGAGTVYVSGTTRSSDLPLVEPLQPEPAGGADAMLARLSSTAELLSSTYLGGPGDDRGEGVGLGPEGEVIMLGRVTEEVPEIDPDGLRFVTAFPVYEDQALAPAPTTFAVRRLDPALTSVASQVTIPLPGHQGPLAVWLPCAEAIPHIGVGETVLQPPCTPNDSYSISLPTGYDGSAVDWRELAMQWKQANSGHIYGGGATWPPINEVLAGDAMMLDFAENSFFTPTNPAGSWQVNLAQGQGALVAGAALYHYRWDSPVFADLLGAPNRAAMITSVHLDTGGGGTLSSLCQSVGWGQPHASGTDIDVVDESCAALTGLFGQAPQTTMCSLGGNLWNAAGAYSEGGSFFAGSVPFDPTLYVGDPPEAEAHVSGYIAEAAQRLNGRIGVVMPVATTEYRGAEPGETSTQDARLRLVDLP